MIRPTMMATALLLAACGSSGMQIQGPPISDGCQIILSGGATASTDQICSIQAVNPSADAGVTFTIAANGASYGTLSFSAELVGPLLALGTFGTTGSSAVVEASTKLSSAAPQEWDQSIHGSDPDTGSMSLEISAVGTPAVSKGVTTWTGCHGNLAATLTPTGAGDAGGVTGHVIF